MLAACFCAMAVQLGLGLGLKRALRARPDVKGWPLWTYWHSMLHTTLVLPAVLFCGLMRAEVLEPTGGSFIAWLERPPERTWTTATLSSLSAEQWVQVANIGFTTSVTLLSVRRMATDPALLGHHAVTVAGCAAWLHGAHGAGFGALFTTWSELGSTMHNVMSLHNNAATRWARVVTDVLTRGGAVVLLLCDARLARARGLPLVLQIWSLLGGGFWMYLNYRWTRHVFLSLVRPNGHRRQPEPHAAEAKED